MSRTKKTLGDFGFPSNYSRTSKSDVFNFLSNSSNKSILNGYFTRDPKNGETKSGFYVYFIELYHEFQKTIFPKESEQMSFIQLLWHFLQDDINLNLGLCKKCGKDVNLKDFHKDIKHIVL